MDISNFLAGVQLDSLNAQPLYKQIAEVLATKIRDHSFPAETKLPPERELAGLFGVSRTTAINTYRYLEEQGLVTTRIGSGTFVRDMAETADITGYSMPWAQLFTPYTHTPLSSILKELVSAPATGDHLSLAAGMPDPALYPLPQISSLVHKYLSTADFNDFGHIPTEGYTPLRNSLAAWLNEHNVPAGAENVFILSGSQQGLYLMGKALLEPGDYVITESPTFVGAIQVFQSMGARILTLPTSEAFPFALLEDYLIRYRPKLLYLIPSFQNPTGRVLSEETRKRIISLATRHQLIILEDDPYSQLYFDEPPPASLKALDSYGGVVYLGTFSKFLFPGLRTGFMVAHPALVNRLAHEKQFIDLHSNNLAQWLLHLFMQEGYLHQHLEKVRKVYKNRRNVVAKNLQRLCGNDLEFQIPTGGFYFWCKLTPPLKTRSLLHEASKVGVSLVPGEAFYPSITTDNELRLCFSTHNETQLQDGIERLALAIKRMYKQQGSVNISVTNQTRPII